MFTVDQLLEKFPADLQIQNRDEDALQATINAVIAETNGYIGILEPSTRNQAIALHAAHYTRIEIIAESTVGQYGIPTKIKSKDDELQYGSSNNGYDFSATIYGQRLQKLLDSLYLGGLLV
jgi:hypothetical protein